MGTFGEALADRMVVWLDRLDVKQVHHGNGTTDASCVL